MFTLLVPQQVIASVASVARLLRGEGGTRL